MFKPRNVVSQESQISPELAAEKAAVRKLFHFGQVQSAEYAEAAKALNAKLRDAGLSALCMVEK